MAAVLDGTDVVVVTSNGGITITRHVTPCATAAITPESSVAVIAPDGLALLCTGQGFTGHTVKTVYTSGDLGATWVKTGVPTTAGDGGTIAAANADFRTASPTHRALRHLARMPVDDHEIT